MPDAPKPIPAFSAILGAGQIPTEGAEIVCYARFHLDARLGRAVGAREVARAFEANRNLITRIIATTVYRVYARHGLKVKSGKLKHWASHPGNIWCDFQAMGAAVQLSARWQNPLPYSRTHMWETYIKRTFQRVKRADGTWFMKKSVPDPKKKPVRIPARPYIYLDQGCLNAIARAVSNALLGKLETQYARKTRAEARALKPGIDLWDVRQTKHRARRKLWKSGQYTQAQARAIVDLIWGAAGIKSIVESLIRDARAGKLLIQGQARPGR